MPNRIWVDVEDLFQYAAANRRPSGIQRIAFELCRALATLPESRDRVGFLRHHPVRDGFRTVPFASIDGLHAVLTAAPVRPAPAAPADDGSAAGAADPGSLRRLAYRMPIALRRPLVQLFKSQLEAGRAVAALASGVAAQAGHLSARAQARLGGRGSGRTGSRRPAAVEAVGPDFAPLASPGDVLLVLGSTWFHPFYATMLGRARARHRLRVAVLFYDAIPLIRPEWCDRNLVARFRHWAETLLPLADLPVAISRATGRDLAAFAARAGIALPRAPQVIPVGTGFSRPATAEPPARRTRPVPLPAAGSYVLIVSTIEARKNHALLLRVWRRMLDEMPPGAVPRLVFAGKVGWLVEDLMRQLRNTDFLDGSVVLVEDPRDDELEQLYRGCLFTVFPSFYEGWGLPVTESLGFGRPCVISDASALPEAGGRLARYFDPEDGNAAYRAIRHAIEDRAGTEAWAERVRAEFRPVGWEDAARALLAVLDPVAEADPATAADPADQADPALVRPDPVRFPAPTSS